MPKRKQARRLHAMLAADSGNAPRRKQPSLPAAPWDHGADGPANRIGLVEEAATEIDPDTGKERPNPNKVTRVRRRSWAEQYHLQGKLTGRQLMIAKALRDAAEGARNADPLAAFGRKIDRDSGCPDPLATAYDMRRRFHAMWPLVPSFARFVVEWVVLDDRPIASIPGCGSGPAFARHLERLQRGLDKLADKWGRKTPRG